MSIDKPHADASKVTMSKNIFDVQLGTSSGAQATRATCSCDMSKNASCYKCSPTTSYPDPFLIPLHDDTGISPPSSSSTLHPPNRSQCLCDVYKNSSCSLCSAKTGTEPDTRPSHKQKPMMRLAKKTLPTSSVRLRIPALGASSRAADSQTIQVLPSSSSNDVQMKVEEPAHTPVEITPAATHSPPQIPPNLITIPQETPLSDSCIPKILPPEMQVIIDAYISGTPLNLVASKSVLKARWGVSLPVECGYVYMGFFAVAEVLVSSLPFSVKG